MPWDWDAIGAIAGVVGVLAALYQFAATRKQAKAAVHSIARLGARKEQSLFATYILEQIKKFDSFAYKLDIFSYVLYGGLIAISIYGSFRQENLIGVGLALFLAFVFILGRFVTIRVICHFMEDWFDAFIRTADGRTNQELLDAVKNCKFKSSLFRALRMDFLLLALFLKMSEFSSAPHK